MMRDRERNPAKASVGQLTAPQLQELKDVLHCEHARLTRSLERARRDGPVQLDQQAVGRLSKMDAPQPDVEHSYHLLVVGQDQVARVDATAAELKVVVTGTDGNVVHTLVIPRR